MAMTWTTFHRRGEVLRTVTSTVDARRDGLLPMDVPGVRETFGDELALVAALQLRWHTRLAGRLEHTLMHHLVDPEEAVVGAWHTTAAELPGTRLVLDHHRAQPSDAAMADALRTAAAKEHVLLAVMAGHGSADASVTAAVGRELEQRARATYHSPVAA
jgi:hypothetical protein